MKRTTPGATMRAFAFALLLPLAGGLAGCDSLTGSSNSDSIEGTWVVTDGDYTLFVEITSSTITVYDGQLTGCFEREMYTINEHDGDQYTLEEQSSGFTLTFTIRRQGDNLVVGFGSETETYAPSDQNLDQLEICAVETGGGSDPSIVCADLPTISVGQTVVGDLSAGDDMYNGRYYDLYGLTLTSQTQVNIAAASDAIDTYLFLYQGDGTFIMENDDGGTGTNSNLIPTLDAGCYRIEVTSFFSSETGSYTLSVN